MLLRVVYASDGRIVSLARYTESRLDDAGHRSPQIAVQPGPGQRAAVVELPPQWHERPLAEIHEACLVVEGPEGPSLRSRAAKD